MSDEPHSTDFVDELRQLPREVEPPAALEERTVAALRARSLLRVPRPQRRAPAALWLVAAGVAVVAFVSGLAAGRVGMVRPAPEASFALMLYGGSTGSDTGDHAERADEYRRWAYGEHESGRVIGGEALGDSATAVTGGDSATRGASALEVTDAARDGLVGFFLIQAPDRESALRLAADCPHLKYGGRVVVRAIQPT